MPRYSEQAIDTIKNRLTLSEVVSAYVHLDRKGDRHWGCCPFHHEKTPSFTVVDRDGYYHCFGCGKGGDMFSFIQDIEKVDFSSAVEILARKAGVELVESSPEEKAKKDRKDTVQDIYNKLMGSFNSILRNQEVASKAREYLAKRGITDATVAKFQLGYAVADGNWLHGFLAKKNYSSSVLSDTGLFVKNNWTMFHDRLMFPVRDWRGNCVAFSGRDLTFQDDRKYINSRDTVIYNKKEHLFGFYEGLQTIKDSKAVVICEGNFDVISLHQAGITNAVASLGTAFTAEQAKLIHRYATSVSLLFDNDDAGRAATYKAALICQKEGLECDVILFEGAKDTSELLEKEGAQALVKACSRKTNAFNYLVKSAINKYDIRQPKQRTKVLEEVKPYLDATSSQVERQGYVKYLADVLRTREEDINADCDRMGRNEKPREVDAGKEVTRQKTPAMTAELHALLLAVNQRSLFSIVRKEVRIDQLEDTYAQTLYRVLENAERTKVNSDSLVLEMIGDESLRNLVVQSFVTPEVYRNETTSKFEIEAAVVDIKRKRLEEKRTALQRLIDMAASDNLSDDELADLLAMKSNLDADISELNERLAAIGEIG